MGSDPGWYSSAISVAEAAAYCKCSPRVIREAARRAEFPACEISERAISILRSDLDAWLANHPMKLRMVVDEDEDDEADLEKRLAAE